MSAFPAIPPKVTTRQYVAALNARELLGDDARPPAKSCSISVLALDTGRVHGPVEARVRWEDDPEPFDWGDIDPTPEEVRALEFDPPMGCTVEIRRPALLHPDAPAPCWEFGASLWSIVGDDDYRAMIERDLFTEATS